MAKLKLTADPTFTAKVGIPIAGGEPATVLFTFKHRTQDELKEFVKELQSGKKPTSDVDMLMSIACGWDLEDEFNRENVALMTQMYHAAAQAISEKYAEELTQARLKN